MAGSELTPDKFHLNIYCTQRCQLNLKLLLGNNILDFVPIHIQTGMQLFINIFFHWIDNWNSHKVLTNEEYYELKPTSGLEGFTVMLNVTIAMILSITVQLPLNQLDQYQNGYSFENEESNNMWDYNKIYDNFLL